MTNTEKREETVRTQWAITRVDYNTVPPRIEYYADMSLAVHRALVYAFNDTHDSRAVSVSQIILADAPLDRDTNCVEIFTARPNATRNLVRRLREQDVRALSNKDDIASVFDQYKSAGAGGFMNVAQTGPPEQELVEKYLFPILSELHE